MKTKEVTNARQLDSGRTQEKYQAACRPAVTVGLVLGLPFRGNTITAVRMRTFNILVLVALGLGTTGLIAIRSKNPLATLFTAATAEGITAAYALSLTSFARKKLGKSGVVARAELRAIAGGIPQEEMDIVSRWGKK